MRSLKPFVVNWLTSMKFIPSINSAVNTSFYMDKIFHFTINGFKLDMYSLKMTLACRNMSECSDCNVVYIISAFRGYIK